MHQADVRVVDTDLILGPKEPVAAWADTVRPVSFRMLYRLCGLGHTLLCRHTEAGGNGRLVDRLLVVSSILSDRVGEARDLRLQWGTVCPGEEIPQTGWKKMWNL